MAPMSQQLPPLNALRAFEAVARHLSFTKAAVELNVTRAAISHQIKYLEDFLGFTLIERKNRAITLTRGAEIALPKLRLAFDSLAEAVHLMRGEKQTQSLTVLTTTSFASKWLVPRLHRFSRRYPDIDMQIKGDASLVDADVNRDQGFETFFRANAVDIMIRFGLGHYSGCKSDKLFTVSAVPLCSPVLTSPSHAHPLQQPADLAFHTLLHDDTDYLGHPSWERWLAAQSISGVNPNRGLHFNQVALAMEAAIDGQGVLLSLKALAEMDIDAGRLCVPFDFEIPLEQAYYVIRPNQPVGSQEAVSIFLDWLQEEAAWQME